MADLVHAGVHNPNGVEASALLAAADLLMGSCNLKIFAKSPSKRAAHMLPTARCLHKLPRDAHPLAGLTDEPFQEIVDAELAADPTSVHGLVLVGKGRVPGDDE